MPIAIGISPFSFNFAASLNAGKVVVLPIEQAKRTDSLYQRAKEALHSAVQMAAAGARRFKNESTVGLKSAYGANLLFMMIACCCIPGVLLREGTDSALSKALKSGKQFAIGVAVGGAVKAAQAVVEIAIINILPRCKYFNILIKQHSDPAKQKMIEERTEIFEKNIENYSMTCIWGPLYEELFFRGVIQDITLTIPRISTLYRIELASLGFGLFHLQNGHTGCYSQAINAYAIGCFLGLLKESKAGLTGAIGAHMAYNGLTCYQNWRSHKKNLPSEVLAPKG